jgi:AcrR family transcriptional regulator
MGRGAFAAPRIMYSIIHMRSPRERMVVSAALLIRERGAHATAISDVLEHSGAPRGSAYHYFPGGRTQLLCEAIDYAGDHVAAIIADAQGGEELLDTLIDNYRRQLLDTDFRAGCPVVAVSVEAGEEPEGERMAPVVQRAAAVFDRWCDLIAQRFIADGMPTDRARDAAVLATSALEGAIVLARVRRDLAPLDVVHRQLRRLLVAELPERNPQ